MASLYIHYPFCKQACHYCNFDFSTKLDEAKTFHELIIEEMALRHTLLPGYELESIYFGGGSPSLMHPEAIGSIIQAATDFFQLQQSVEITVELNPDDVNPTYLNDLLNQGVNRVSLGIQSFWSSELQMMNRAHNADQAKQALKDCAQYFNNYSIDLIYGMPGSSLADWQFNLDQLTAFEIPHISAYALTVEPQTALAHKVAKGSVLLLEEEVVEAQYYHLLEQTQQWGLDNYEFSNFGKVGFYSINNTNYWKRKPYLGLGPGAHSYDGRVTRSWNVSNNALYVKGIGSKSVAISQEILSKKDCFNETVMTGLRTQWGIDRRQVEKEFGLIYAEYLEQQAQSHLIDENLFWDGDNLLVTDKAKFLTDGIAADLFLIALES